MVVDPILSPLNSGVTVRRFYWRINSTPVYSAFPTILIHADQNKVYEIVCSFNGTAVPIQNVPVDFGSDGLFTYMSESLFLELERPPKPVNATFTLDQSVLRFHDEADIPQSDIELKLNYPLSYQFGGNTLILRIEHVNPENEMVQQRGLIQLNGVLPDLYGNINIKSEIPSISVRVYTPDISDSSSDSSSDI